MEIEPRDEQIKAIYTDIKDKEIDLRPDFQRGEVWSTARKRLLIDSIFRGWHIPPIHLIKVEGNTSEVLDGQQRLTAIRDFVDNQYSIDGTIQPVDEDILALNKLKFRDLNEEQVRQFNRYRIKVFEIVRYNHGEPGELFHRLNQSVKLTSAEQRNAFFGNIRDQVSDLVGLMVDLGVDKNVLGFSNSRMAYNDLLTRVCFTLENETIRTVITDKLLNERFRCVNGFDENIIEAVKGALVWFSKMKEGIVKGNLNLTKASSMSWLYYISDLNLKKVDYNSNQLEMAFHMLEKPKSAVKVNDSLKNQYCEYFGFSDLVLKELMLIYIERCSSRVTSLGSILIRDLLVSLSCYKAEIFTNGIDSSSKLLLELEGGLNESNVDVKSLIENLSENWKA